MTTKNYRKVANQLKAILKETLPEDVMQWGHSKGLYGDISAVNKAEILEVFDRHFNEDVILQTCEPKNKFIHEGRIREASKRSLINYFGHCFCDDFYAKKGNNQDFYKNIDNELRRKVNKVFGEDFLYIAG